jgi:hypothetical protein
MNDFPYQTSLLARDQKVFLQLTPEEVDVWIPRVFERVKPHMPMINAFTFEEDIDDRVPVNLEVLLMIASKSVREVAVEMAAAVLTAERQRQLLPMLNAYCDELLAEDRTFDATFVQQGLIGIQRGQLASQNPLLIEVCLTSIHYQVMLINGGPHAPLPRTQ